MRPRSMGRARITRSSVSGEVSSNENTAEIVEIFVIELDTFHRNEIMRV